MYVRLRLDSQGRIANLTVDASTQTAEIGGVCEEEAFTEQFIGKALPLAQEDIPDAVSGATMTSAAVGAAINAARTDSGDQWEKTLKFTVIGILDTGGEEENYLFLSMSDMDTLTASGGRLDVVELSISASAEELERFLTGIRNRTDGLTARLIKRVTKSETAVLSVADAGVPSDRHRAGTHNDLRVHHHDGCGSRAAQGNRPAQGAGRVRWQHPHRFSR